VTKLDRRPRSPRFLPTRPKRSTLGVDGNVAVMAVTIKDIRVVRAELQQFNAKQTDFAVRFHIAVVDANLRAASEGHDDPISEKVSQCALKIWPPAFGIQDAAAVRYDAFFAKRH
jgi:hypothetical protein